MIRIQGRVQGKGRSQGGFTLIELMIVVAIIGILATMAITLWASLQTQARISRAQADARTLVSAVSMYLTHMESLPTDLAALNVVATNAAGQTAGPFVKSTPTQPDGWSAYSYSSASNGSFTISTSGDSTTVSLP
jgi:general secretion pathway protein G